MTDGREHQSTDLPPEAAAILNMLLENAERWGLPPDPAAIMYTSLKVLLSMCEGDRVLIGRDDLAAVGITGMRPGELH